MADNSIMQDLLALSRQLGDPERQWAILGEGNTSARVDDETFYVKASGSQLGKLMEQNVTHVRFAPILEALHDSRDYNDAQIKDLLYSSCVHNEKGLRPSTETVFHAFLLSLPDVNFVGHTHVISINGLMCSAHGWQAVKSGGRMFPDEIVVCGVAPCCVPYVDPGIPLARALRRAVLEYQDRHGMRPKAIYMQNHGFTALARTAQEVENIHLMADKAAQIMLGAMACGGPAFLTTENVDRIFSRPDEHYRQRALGIKEDRPADGT
ncbi:MAG: class II aldolase/adducin family protein [Armatimonadetes bacterium]|nr:class II aldolase/adducin family protein [Armatimonadota bacterium]